MDDKNGISIHAWKKSHRVNWSESRVLKIVPNFLQEANRSVNNTKHRTNTTSNLDRNLELNSTWTPFLSKLHVNVDLLATCIFLLTI